MKMVSKAVRRYLAVFDFDHTMIDGNSDIAVKNLLSSDKIPDDIHQLYKSDGWTVYMRKIFEELNACNITREEILTAVRSIPFTPGMDHLLKWLKCVNVEVIVISDSNSVFINDYLINTSCDNCVAKVFTNPAVFNKNGCLDIEMFHRQDWCSLSTENLCKGYILQSYIEERSRDGVDFSFVAYVGDGANDFCPVLKLTHNDIAFPRVGFTLEKKILITKDSEEDCIKATVIPWVTGNDIIDALKLRINSEI